MDMNTILIIAAIVLGVLLLIGLIIFIIRAVRFRPNPNKLAQQNQLNADLKPVGFAYELKGDYFYSLMDCWQREMGYCRLYDEGAALFNMIMDCEPVTFFYGGKRWLIELWKGQYGITTGAEIGIYNTSREDIDDERFKGTFYEAIQNEERIPISFVLKKNGKKLFRRSAVHWWLTGFKLGEYSSPDSLTLDAKLTFPTKAMCSAFVGGLTDIGYTRKEYSVRRCTVTIHYTKPHTAQPVSRNKVQQTLVQQTNHNNCRLYEFATAKYSDTLDKLEYAKAVAPEIYELFVHSLYARGLYDAFEWIIELIHGKHPHPEPEPKPEPCPCPPRPEPCPPCCPCPPVPEPCPCPPVPEPCLSRPQSCCPCSSPAPEPCSDCTCPSSCCTHSVVTDAYLSQEPVSCQTQESYSCQTQKPCSCQTEEPCSYQGYPSCNCSSQNNCCSRNCSDRTGECFRADGCQKNQYCSNKAEYNNQKNTSMHSSSSTSENTWFFRRNYPNEGYFFPEETHSPYSEEYSDPENRDR